MGGTVRGGGGMVARGICRVRSCMADITGVVRSYWIAQKYVTHRGVYCS